MIESARKARPRRPAKRTSRKRAAPPRTPGLAAISACIVIILVFGGFLMLQVRARYTFSLQWPLRIRLQWPLAIAPKLPEGGPVEAEADQGGRPLTPDQQYACGKFGRACRVALAIQRAENARGACEVYHYNTDGTLDWGYFQINTVHLKRVGLNLRDLLDCHANIDFAFQLYQQRGFSPWSTYKNGDYRRYMRD